MFDISGLGYMIFKIRQCLCFPHAPVLFACMPPALAAPERGMAMLEGQHPVESARTAGADREHDSALRQGEGKIFLMEIDEPLWGFWTVCAI